MGFSFKNFLKGIRLIPNSSDTTSQEGDIQVVDSSNKVVYHNGSSSSPIVTEVHASQGSNRLKNKDLEDSSTLIVDASDTTKQIAFDAGGTTGTKTTITGAQTANRVLTLPDATDTLTANAASQTLTNKSIDADQNTITNIENADIKVGAAIDRTKLASGSNNHVLINNGSGVMSSEATLAKSRGGSGQDNSSITFPASGTLVTETGTQTLTNKTLSGNTATNLVSGSGTTTFNTSGTITLPNGTDTLVGKNTTDTLTNKTLTSPVITTPTISGQVNTNQVSLAEISTPVSLPSSGYGQIYFKSDGFLYQRNSDGAETKVGAGSGGINYITNPDAESNTDGWGTYKNASVKNIPDGTTTTTGVQNLSLARNISNPLRGTASFAITRSGASQGAGVYYEFTIDRADQGTPLQVSFDYNADSAFTAADGITAPLNDNTTSTNAGNSDIEVFIYDVDNSKLIVPTPQVIAAKGSNNFKYKGEFQTNIATGGANSYKYRLILHHATTNSSAMTFKFDNVVVGPTIEIMGAPVTDWQSYTPTFNGLGTVSSINFFWRRVGDSLEVKGTATTGTVTSGQIRISFPSGLSIDTAKTGSVSTIYGRMTNNYTSAAGVNTSHTIMVHSGQTSNFSASNFADGSSANNLTELIGTAPIGNNTQFSMEAKGVPIAGWASNVVLSNDTDTRVVAARYGETSSGSYSNGSVINFNNKEIDTHSAVSGGRFTAPISGMYKITGAVKISSYGATAGMNLRLDLYKDGSQFCNLQTITIQATYTSDFVFSGGTELYLSAGQIVDLRFNSFTGSPTLTGSGTYNYFTVSRLSGPATVAASEFIAASYYSTAGDSVTGTSQTRINYNTKVIDTHNAVTTGTGTWKFTAPASGTYQVSAFTTTDASGGTINAARAFCQLYKNGSGTPLILGYHLCETTNTVGCVISGTGLIQLNAGDYINVNINKSGGVTDYVLNTTAGNVRIDISKVSN